MFHNYVKILAFIAVASLSFAAMAQATKHPCEQVKEACLAKGFVKNQAKAGTGLWVDCIDPIMKGTPQPPKAKLTLPTVDPGVVAACKAKRPNFGEGRH